MRGRPRKWTNDQLRAAVKHSSSVAEVLRQLGLRVAGGNYSHIQSRVAALSLETSHWTGQAHLRGKTNPHVSRRPLRSILQKGTRYQSNKLRKRLLREGLLAARCSSCSGTQWMGQAIPLELDHKDGDTSNNELGNLQLICPNCHALTSTYRGKNARYAHIPPAAEVQAGIHRCGSMAAYGREKSVTAGTVRNWLRRGRK